MFSDVSLHLIYKIANAAMHPFPFPHIFVRDVFPKDFYEEIRAHLPPKETFKTLRALQRVGPAYPDSRLVLPLEADHLSAVAEPYRGFWSGIAGWLLGGAFGSMVVPKFGEVLQQRFGDLRRARFHDEALLVQDYTTYALGPHTDAPAKVLSFLFYLPQDESQSHLGTSIYLPKDPAFRSSGEEHYPFDGFHRVATMPYLPNSLFAFVKTDNSFHGVEPFTEAAIRRDLLLYDIKVGTAPASSRPEPGASSGVNTSVKFSF